MQIQSAVAQSAAAATPSDAPPRLRGRRLLVARAGWLIGTMLSLALFAVSVPLQWSVRQTICPAVSCPDGYLRPEIARAIPSLGLSLPAYAGYIVALDVVFVLGFVAIGTVIFWRRADEPIALFAASALVLFGTTWPLLPDTLAETSTGLGLFAQIWARLGFALFAIFFYLFPTGRFVPRWTRVIALYILVDVPIKVFLPGSPLNSETWPALPRNLFGLFGFGTLVFAQAYRYRRVSGPVERQQTKWVVFGVSATIVGGATYLIVGGAIPALQGPGRAALLFDLVGRTVFGTFTLLLIPLAIGIAILRRRLWDIDLIIDRALVYGALSASVVGIYALIIGALGFLFQARGNPTIALFATVLTALLFQPLRGRLQRGVNRLLYGERDDPYKVLSQLGRRLDATLAPDAILPAIVATVRETLKLPYVAISLNQDAQDVLVERSDDATQQPNDQQHSAGKAPIAKPTNMIVLPLIYQGERVGELRLAPRVGESELSPADRRLLDDLARQAGVAAYTVRLTADLQRSRERLVAAREEERRRLRRDLHDGLGSTLAGLNLQVGALRGLITRDPAAADALAVDLRADIRAAIADIRRLAYDLRPPALDELGLVGAIHARATSDAHSDDGQGAPQISVDAPEQLPPLPAAVEVAAYRIIQEALTNVLHHAHARRCTIRIALTSRLELEVDDDGIGLASGRRSGVGTLSMHERAAELGGRCTIEPADGGGTRVHAWLPLP